MIRKILLLTLLVVLLEESDIIASTDFLSRKVAQHGSDVSNSAQGTRIFKSLKYVKQTASYASSEVDGRIISKNFVMSIVEDCWREQFVWLEVVFAFPPSITIGTSIFWTFLAPAIVQTGAGLF